MNYNPDNHILIIIAIMVFGGGFGGYLNYLHNFDTTEKDLNDNRNKTKYILLGVGAAFLVPAFLKMIASELVSGKDIDNINYLIFAGFCLIAAIFSRRFINTIGEKILEAAKKAEKTGLENKRKLELTQLELTSTQERIKDVKAAVDVNNIEPLASLKKDDTQKDLLIKLANKYVERTSVPNYSERLRLKAELGRRMGIIIVRNNLSKDQLLESNYSEGMLLALSYSVQLRPDEKGLNILNKISKLASQLFTKYTILVSYDTLSENSFIDKSQVYEINSIVESFRKNADSSLISKIENTIAILNVIDPTGIKE